jgi:hypothetical protein
MRSNVRERTHVQFVNAPCSHLYSFGFSSKLMSKPIKSAKLQRLFTQNWRTPFDCCLKLFQYAQLHYVVILFRFETRDACEKNCPVRKENHTSEQIVKTCDEDAVPPACNRGCKLTKDSNNCPKCNCANQSKYSQPLKTFSIN